MVRLSPFRATILWKPLPMLAILEFSDYSIIALLILVFAGGAASAASRFKSADRARLQRLEAKLDFALKRLGIEYEEATGNALSDEVKALADTHAVLNAIKVHREQTGLSLREAKDDVEAYMSRPR